MLLIFVVSLVIMACMRGGASRQKKLRKVWNPNCSLPLDDGPCRARIPSYYFDNRTCREFMYGGCEGNANNFETLEACQEACKGNRRRKNPKERPSMKTT
uniref:Putative salivary kunitz domain protein n=1 Tax=Ixodes ricinus TaxID=34613 RepID=A0A0K8RDD3_IXORI